MYRPMENEIKRGVIPYKCVWCEKSFSQFGNLITHNNSLLL